MRPLHVADRPQPATPYDQQLVSSLLVDGATARILVAQPAVSRVVAMRRPIDTPISGRTPRGRLMGERPPRNIPRPPP